MICPYCKKDDDKVIDTRSSDGGLGIRRRRECNSCGRRFTSYEKTEDISIQVQKKDGKKEIFDINKVIRSVEIACRKRPITAEQIKELATLVEMQSFSSESKEIYSKNIGDLIMKELKKIDPVAYVRFSSVYRDYQNVDQFIQDLQRMKGKDPE